MQDAAESRAVGSIGEAERIDLPLANQADAYLAG
jgi:hypothetical protein